MNLKFVMVLLFSFFITAKLQAEEWIFHLKPNEIKMESSTVLRTPQWFRERNKNSTYICNLSFFTTKTYVGPYKDDSVTSNSNKKRWPVLYVSETNSEILKWNETRTFDYKYMVSGFPLLIQNTNKLKVGKTYFHKRNCPRTAMGVLGDGRIVLYITTASNIQKLQNRMFELGCVSALNLDGGSSTFLLKNGELTFPKRLHRRYPNVLIFD